jgi:hypothetical protein
MSGFVSLGGGGIIGSENLNFATTLYTGNGSTQSVVTGKNNAAGSLTWIKGRTAAANHFLFDTIQGVNKYIASNNTDAQTSLSNSLTTFNSNGFSVGSSIFVNDNTVDYVVWTFLEAAGFFDIVNYTGNNSSGATNISHNLGVIPACIIIKNLGATGDWRVWHKDIGVVSSTVGSLKLNTNAAAVGDFPPIFQISGGTTSDFYVAFDNNVSGNNYIAYLFAHNPSKKIACGGFVGDGSGMATVNCGFAPKWVLFKRRDGVEDWILGDNLLGDAFFRINTSNSESGGTPRLVTFLGNNFIINGIGVGNNYIYIAIG